MSKVSEFGEREARIASIRHIHELSRKYHEEEPSPCWLDIGVLLDELTRLTAERDEQAEMLKGCTKVVTMVRQRAEQAEAALAEARRELQAKGG